MYAAALALSAGVTAGTTGLPFFQLGALNVGIPIQAFGVIVAAGVLIGASILRRYAEWHGVSDEHIRGITGWITVSGFIGAHVFDVIAYQWHDLMEDPILLFKVWAGISSYGGFIGGAIGFAIYVWWKRQPARLFADICIVGLLPAFSIGRIGCTVVSDHIGAAVDPNAWYRALAMDYPRDAIMSNSGINHLFITHPNAGDIIPAWNLGLIEFLYLVPVNALILFLAFRSTKRMPAGLLIVLAGIFYAPVRFGLDFLRPENSDPRYAGLTFAQWASFAAFGAAVYLATRIMRNGAPAETVAPTSGEAQERLRTILKDTSPDDAPKKKAAVPKATVAKERAPEAKSEPDSRSEERKRQDEAAEAEAAERRARQDAALAAKEKARLESEAAAKAASAEKKAAAAAKAAADPSKK